MATGAVPGRGGEARRDGEATGGAPAGGRPSPRRASTHGHAGQQRLVGANKFIYPVFPTYLLFHKGAPRYSRMFIQVIHFEDFPQVDPRESWKIGRIDGSVILCLKQTGHLSRSTIGSARGLPPASRRSAPRPCPAHTRLSPPRPPGDASPPPVRRPPSRRAPTPLLPICPSSSPFARYHGHGGEAVQPVVV